MLIMETQTLKTKKRISWIDIAKFFAIFLVVIGHTFDESNPALQFIYLFRVPFFFFLSGITYSYKENQLEFIKNKIIRLYIPYFIVSLISIVVYLLMGSVIGANIGFNGPDILGCLYGMLYANVSAGNMMWNRPLWFLPALLVVLIITNLIEAIKNRPIRVALFIGLSALGYYLSSLRVFLPLQTETALSMLVWIFLGILLKKSLYKLKKKSKPTLIVLAILLFLVGYRIGLYNGSISVMVDLYGKYVYLYIISAFCLSMVFIIISFLIDHNSIMEYIGRNTLAILLWHKFPIEFFQLVCPGVKNWLISPNLIIADITTFFVAVISIILSLLFQAIYLKIFNNIRKRKIIT